MINEVLGLTKPAIELLYVITFSLIMLFSLLAYYKKMSMGIAIISLITGIGVAWLFAPYMDLAISPIENWLIYGYAVTWHVYVAVAHLFSLFAMVIIAGYNLLVSGGKIIWA